MIKLMVIQVSIVFFLGTILNAKDYVCIEKERRDRIEKDLKPFKHKCKGKSALNCGVVFWPHCKKIKKGVLNRETIPEIELKLSVYWLKQKLKQKIFPKKNLDSLIYYRDKRSGDDLIMFKKVYNNKYTQFIDGRSITILIESDFHITDTGLALEKMMKGIKPFIFPYTLGRSGKYFPSISYADSNQVYGAFIDPGHVIKELVNKRKHLFWTNGKYIILDISKMREPYYLRGYQGQLTIGGLGYFDKREFRRFRKKGNINFIQEMHKIFPWVKDSIKAKKERVYKESDFKLIKTPKKK